MGQGQKCSAPYMWCATGNPTGIDGRAVFVIFTNRLFSIFTSVDDEQIFGGLSGWISMVRTVDIYDCSLSARNHSLEKPSGQSWSRSVNIENGRLICITRSSVSAETRKDIF